MLRRGFNLLILVLVTSVLIEGAITAITRKSSTRAPTRSAPSAAGVPYQPWASTSPLLRQNFDEDGAGVAAAVGVDEACQCVMFYLCDEGKAVENNTQCEVPMVCCRADTKVLIPGDSLASSESAEFSGSSSSASSDSVPSSTSGELGVDDASLVSSTSAESFVDNASPVSSTSTESFVDNPSPPVSTSFGIGDFVECGIDRSTDPRTTSDKNAVFMEFPWMVAILRTSQDSTAGDTLICGGSLLSPYVVLTAAHCIHNLDITTLKIRSGDLVLNGDSTEETLPHQDRTVQAITMHKNFSSRILHNDLALINLDEPFIYSPHVAPVCSPAIDSSFASADSYDSNDCIVTGWTRGADNMSENKLRRVPAKILSKSNCEENLRETRLGRNFKLHPSFLCAKEEESVCKGDGGGPLVCVSHSNRRKYIQVGVVSWGVGCDSKLPGVYASLEANSEWITAELDKLNALRGS